MLTYDTFLVNFCFCYEARVKINLLPVNLQLLKRLSFFSLNYFHTFVEKQLTINVRVYIWTLNSILLICMCCASLCKRTLYVCTYIHIYSTIYTIVNSIYIIVYKMLNIYIKVLYVHILYI